MAANDKLTVGIDPRLLARVEEYATAQGADLRAAVEELLIAGLSKLEPRNGGSNGKRKAVTA